MRRVAAQADHRESPCARLFHSHTYFDHNAPERVAEASRFMDLIRRTFASTEDVRVTSFTPVPAGPHPRGNFEVVFTRDAFVDYVSWLMFTRPESLDILIHPVTRSWTLDHTTRALWLGAPVAIDRTVFEAMEARSLPAGGTGQAAGHERPELESHPR